MANYRRGHVGPGFQSSAAEWQIPVDRCSQFWDHHLVVIVGEDRISRFARNHAGARKPLQRFLYIASKAEWPHFPAVKRTFATTDYAPESGTLIFDIGGNRYRLVAHVDFAEQIMVIQSVMTHGEYNRECF